MFDTSKYTNIISFLNSKKPPRNLVSKLHFFDSSRLKIFFSFNYLESSSFFCFVYCDQVFYLATLTAIFEYVSKLSTKEKTYSAALLETDQICFNLLTINGNGSTALDFDFKNA